MIDNKAGFILWSPFSSVKSAVFKSIRKKLTNPFIVFDAFWGKELMNKFKNSFNSRLLKTAGALDTVSKLVLIGGGLIGASAAGLELYDQIRRRAVANRIFDRVVRKDPYLSQLPKNEVREYYETLKEVSPMVASNPLLLRTALKQMATYEGADPNSILMLSKIESETRNSTLNSLYRLADRLMVAAKTVPVERPE